MDIQVKFAGAGFKYPLHFLTINPALQIHNVLLLFIKSLSFNILTLFKWHANEMAAGNLQYLMSWMCCGIILTGNYILPI